MIRQLRNIVHLNFHLLSHLIVGYIALTYRRLGRARIKI